MHTINVIDPKTGQAHEIPFDQLHHALEAGGQFADEDQKNKAISIQKGTYTEETPESKPLELTLTKGVEKKGADWKGLASDVLHMLGGALKGGAAFALKAPGNLAEIASETIHHPLSYPPHVAQQVLAGLAGGARDVANVPHKLFDELADRGITPNWLRTGSIPEDTGLEKFLGLEPTKKSDELLRALPALYGGGKLLAGGASKIKKVTSAPDLRQALKDTQAKVNAMDEGYGKTLDKIESEVETRGINQIPVDEKLLTEAKSLLDKSPETKALIESAKKGDYKALRQLQADLRVIGENALSNKLSTERNVGKQAMSVRDRINKGIEDFFESSGNKDLAEDLSSTRAGYRNMKDIYFSTPALARAFGKSKKLPKSLTGMLTEDSIEMKKFLQIHPELKAALEKTLKHQKKMKRLSKIGTTGATALGVEGLEKLLK